MAANACKNDSREAAQECSPRRKPWDDSFSAKQRLPLIRTNLRSDLFAYLGGIVRELRDTAIIVNGTTDHVHMLVRMRPSQSAADLVRLVKANSSRWATAKGNADFAWQTGYGAFRSANLRSPKSRDISRGRKSTIGGARFKRSFCFFSSETTLPSTKNISGIRFCRPSRARSLSWTRSHGLRRGLHSCAASRLAGGSTWRTPQV